MAKIAVIIGNQNQQQSFLKLFDKEGFEVVEFSEISPTKIDWLVNMSPDIILLDLELPGTDGIEVCHQLKNEKKVKSFVVLLSNQPEEYIQLEAFKVGADDYLSKNINQRVLVKKVKALLKRSFSTQKVTPVKSLQYKNIVVDKESYVIYKDQKMISLPKKDFEILVMFLSNPNKIYTREDIYKRIWDSPEGFNTRIIDVHIRKIRAKLGDYLIETVKGIGYKLA
ncbi:MAG: response regulator transcription factor [Flavobacteriales bacterium]|nr:response regulator transcription factor [Flavobacteriales bacterium]MCB9336041.1 response regulator transcription factor [Flavobacteriales bacterium]